MDQHEKDLLQKQLVSAASEGDLAKVKTLLRTTDVEINGRAGNPIGTALHHAIKNSQLQVIQFLLDSNADINSKGGSFEATALCGAAVLGQARCAKLLLENGANVNDRCYRGSTLQIACKMGHKDLVQLLLEHGADVNLPGADGFAGALHAAAKWAHEDIVRMLLENGAEVNARNDKGESAIVGAVEMVDIPKILLLLEYGAKIDIVTLRVAAMRKHDKTLQVLLEAFPDSLALDCDYDGAVGIMSASLVKITPPVVEYSRNNLTIHQVRTVWDIALGAHKYELENRYSILKDWQETLPDRKIGRCRRFCRNLYERARSPASHFEDLDRLTSSKLFYHRFWAMNARIRKSALDDMAIVNGAWKMLCQLPLNPPPLSYRKLAAAIGTGNSLHKCFFLNSERGAVPGWGGLKTTALMSTLVIQLALCISCDMTRERRPSLLLSFLGEALNTAFEMASASEISDTDEDAWFVVKAFLWTTWQQTRVLLLSNHFRGQVKNGLEYAMSETWNKDLQEFSFSSKVMESISDDQQKPFYMCNWAYRLMATMDSPATLDLRGLVSRYSDLWGERPPRCNDSRPCSGDSPEECLRFTGRVIVDQSAHDQFCGLEDRCYRICWDRASYHTVGACASVHVGKDVPKGQRAVYCRASERTLAISHVWAHGQGGRPETGINCCLHRRYCDVARRLDCDSYWIDTMCIPEDHTLRGKAIMAINTTFQRSKACLVCDRDVMEIDISGLKNGTLSRSAQIRLQESILAAVIFCDWNVRAWTFLESMQSRDKIMFLCKNNDTISLLQTLEVIMGSGSVDIGIAFLMAPHLLPSSVTIEDETDKASDDFFRDLDLSLDDGPDDNKKLEEAAACLRYRPASRECDAFIIWTILADEPTLRSPHEFWKNRRGSLLTTGFLMSGASRVKAKGLTWAPTEPTSRKVSCLFSKHGHQYPDVEMMVTNKGEITDAGFSATWDVLHLEIKMNTNQEEGGYLSNDDLAPVLRDLHEAVRVEFQPTQNTVALLRPLLQTSERHLGRWIGVTKNSVLPFVAVCEFCAEDGGWTWLGVRMLDIDHPLPKFVPEEILLV
ncbi:hypothetical protein BJX76DRAFT_357122 [Aspergillus varians]